MHGVEENMKVGWVYGVFLRSDERNNPTACYEKNIQNILERMLLISIICTMEIIYLHLRGY